MRAVVQSGVCPEDNSNEVEITIVNPAPAPNVTAPAQICVDVPAPVSSNDPTPGIGNWQCVNATGGGSCFDVVFTNPAGNNTTVVIGTPGNYTLRREHVGPFNCPATTEDFIITVAPEPTPANAGADLTICADNVT